MAGILADAAAKFGVPAAVLAAIASRESRCGRALDNGWGDNGNGKGAAWFLRTAERIKREGEMARGEAHGDGIEVRRHIGYMPERDAFVPGANAVR